MFPLERHFLQQPIEKQAIWWQYTSWCILLVTRLALSQRGFPLGVISIALPHRATVGSLTMTWLFEYMECCMKGSPSTDVHHRCLTQAAPTADLRRPLAKRLLAPTLLSSILLLSSVGCSPKRASEFIVQEHNFTVTSLPKHIALGIRQRLQEDGINVRMRETPRGLVRGEPIGDFTYTIAGQGYYTSAEFMDLVSSLQAKKGEHPIVLRSTKVSQTFSSAAGLGEASMYLSLALSPGARAYYRDTGEEVILDGPPKNGIARFFYPREQEEEYVDIYVLPEGVSPRLHPTHFQRVHLHAPFHNEVLPWQESWYERFKRKLMG